MCSSSANWHHAWAVSLWWYGPIRVSSVTSNSNSNSNSKSKGASVLRISLMRVCWWAISMLFLYFPQKSEDNSYVLSQCRVTVLLTVHIEFFVFIYILSLVFSHFGLCTWWRTNFQPEFLTLLFFVPFLKDSWHGYPLTVYMHIAP